MAWYFVVFVFISSCFVLSWIGSRLVNSLIQIGKYLNWREFVIAFFVMSFATSLPNFFVDFGAVLHNLPEIALGDIIGGNLVDLTLVLGIAVFFSRKGLLTKSEMVQKTAVFTAAIAVLPLLLIWDGKLDRIDGVILLFAFLFYTWWLFAEKGRFKKIYDGKKENPIKGYKSFLVNLAKAVVFLILLLVSSWSVVWSAQFFSQSLGISLALVGLLIVGLGNCFPETYFAIVSAREEENWLVLGDLMGSVIVCSTLVLGLIALMHPFVIEDVSLFFAARAFLIIAAAFSLLFTITGKKITKKEALFLIFIYIAFLIAEIFIK